jgi:hypothetical protein
MRLDIQAHAFNDVCSAWEPLLEKWIPKFNCARDSPKSPLVLQMYASDPLQVNITAALLEMAIENSQKWKFNDGVRETIRLSSPKPTCPHTTIQLHRWR